MFLRIRQAVKKFIFCYTITADLDSFFRLVRNTKRFRWGKTNAQDAEKYLLHIGNKICPIHLRTFEGDLDIFYENFLQKVYDEIDIDSSKTIVDLGANIGMSALYFLSKSKNAKLICVEPELSNYELLQRNLKCFSNRVVSVNGAVSNINGVLFLKNEGLKYNVSLAESGVPVKSFRLLELIKEYNIDSIDLLKIDIEGAESLLFNNHEEWIDKVRNIIIEIHSEENEKKCLEILRSNGFDVRRADKFHSIFIAVRTT